MEEAIHVSDLHARSPAIISAFLDSGFRSIPNNVLHLVTLLPCPLGTFSNSSAKGADECKTCPPGMSLNVSPSVFFVTVCRNLKVVTHTRTLQISELII